MSQIINIKGETQEVECIGCAREAGKITLGNIITSKYFDAHQDYEIPIPGFVIISSRRHIKSVDEFTDEEQKDFIEFLVKVRKTMRDVLDIKVIYMVQEEDTRHHFHLWLFPRYDWMEEKFGKKIQSVRPIMEWARENMKNEDNLKVVDESLEKMKGFLQNIIA